MNKKPIEICSKYISGKNGCEYLISEQFCKLPDKFKCVVYDYLFYGKISVSEANVWMKCHKLYQYTYIDGIDMLPLMKPKSMRIGIAGHKGLELILQKGSFDDLNLDDYFYEDDEKERGIIQILLAKLSTFNLEKENCIPEYRFQLNFPDTPKINGVIDKLYPDHFSEVKFTSRPEYFISIHFLQSQLAVYFLSNNNLKYCNMQVIRVPQLKQGKTESMEVFLGRIKDDVDKRTGYYFIGYNKDTNTFGKKFYRTEFDLDEALGRFRHIMQERRLAISKGYFYKNEGQCLLPTPCMYLNVCETDGVSDLIYIKKEIEDL